MTPESGRIINSPKVMGQLLPSPPQQTSNFSGMKRPETPNGSQGQDFSGSYLPLFIFYSIGVFVNDFAVITGPTLLSMSARNQATMTLCLELIFEIVEILVARKDRRTLFSLSLVSRDWGYPTRKYLFSSLALPSRQSLLTAGPEVFSSSYRTIPHKIKCFKALVDFGHRPSSCISLSQAIEQGRFEVEESVTIQAPYLNVLSMGWNFLSQWSNVHTVTIQGKIPDFLDFFSHLSSLVQLTILNIDVEFGEDRNLKLPPKSALRSLKELKITSASRTFLRLLPLTNLERLKVLFMDKVNNHLIANFLRRHGKKLKELIMCLSPCIWSLERECGKCSWIF
jgi:hypothetical protein